MDLLGVIFHNNSLEGWEKFVDTFLMFVVMIPLYVILILTFLFPKESMLWGNRWMYREQPEFSEEAIRYAKISSIIGIVILTLILISNLF